MTAANVFWGGAPRLMHEHVAGLRFDREPCHAVHTARGLRWTPLAWPSEGATPAQLNVCVLRHVFGVLARRKLDAAQLRAIQRQRRNLATLRVPGLRVQATRHQGLSLPDLAELALDAIRQGRVCLLKIQADPSRTESRLVMVTGVETQLGPVVPARALLVLDPADAQPWASGHNARLPTSQPSQAAVLHRTTGHLLRCQVTGLIEWSMGSGC